MFGGAFLLAFVGEQPLFGGGGDAMDEGFGLVAQEIKSGFSSGAVFEYRLGK
jgi:hypothetical protein